MKKIVKQKPQEEQSVDILKRVAKRVEEVTVDISSMKSDLKFMNLRLGNVEHNTGIMKVDIEKLKSDLANTENNIGSELLGFETRLNKRISNVADLITIQLGNKIQNHEKRIKKIEQIQQVA